MVGARVRLAREVCGITQEELADAIGTTQSGIASIESGVYRPSDGYLKNIAVKTGFAVTFFEKGELPELPFGSLLYRAAASVKPPDKTKAHAIAQVAFELAALLADKLKKIPINIPRLTDHSEECARITRTSLGLAPHNPIRNLVSILERNGVIVLSLPIEIYGFDGFSAWTGEPEKPVIALLRGKTAYREKFTCSEELAHLIMHSPLRTDTKNADIQAREFAQEFLLPEEVMRFEMQPPITVSRLAALKLRWGVSMAFLAKRASSLGIIAPNQYRYLMQQIRSNWGSLSEPGDENVKPESPRLLRTMAELRYGKPINLANLSKDCGVPARILRDILLLEDNPITTTKAVLEFKTK